MSKIPLVNPTPEIMEHYRVLVDIGGGAFTVEVTLNAYNPIDAMRAAEAIAAKKYGAEKVLVVWCAEIARGDGR